MGAGASTGTGTGTNIKATVAASSVADIRAALVELSGEDKAKLIEALAPAPAAAPASELAPAPAPGLAVPEGLTKMLELRKISQDNGGKFTSWLAQTREQAIEPDLEIVDAHHHLWDMRELKGYNLFGMFKQQFYLTDEIFDDLVGGGHKVTHSIFVTTHAFFTANAEPPWMAPLGEVQFVQGIAAQFASGKYGPLRVAAAIVGGADLAKYGVELEPLLVACKAASPNYRGIRCSASHDPKTPKANFHPTPGMYAEPKFREGFALLGKHGLVFDAWVYSSQLADVHDLAQAFPETSIVLNHAGTPVAGLGHLENATEYDGKQAEILEGWKEAMKRIADECPNVVVKVGGWAIPQMGHGLTERAAPVGSDGVVALFKEAYLWTIATFGAARCMFEGNFPVDKCSMSYTVLWNAYKKMTAEAGLSEADRALLFGGTAKRVYNISAAP